jgi:glycosyltransferase involved in cell wall biosynthesis
MNKNTPLISIIVAIYNVDKFITKCIKSVCSQTYQNLEIILVDDCSTDNSGKICDEFALIDKRIRVFHHTTNRRQSAVRNTGLDNANGEYIVFVDGDDWLADDCVEYFLKLITKYSADLAISYNNFTSRDFKQISEEYTEIWNNETATANFLYSRISIGVWNKIYKREFIEKNRLRFKPLFTAEGFRFLSDCSQRTEKIAVGRRKVYYYRLNNENSATTLPDIRQGLNSLKALNGIEHDLIIKTPLVLASIRHHRWINHFYTLMIIIETKSIEDYLSIYKNCISYIRHHGLRVAIESNNISYGLRIILKTIFPVWVAKIAIKRKQLRLRMDKTD